MAEDDALIKLKVDDSSLNEQFAKVEQSLKNLGSVNLTGLTNTFSKLSSELQASAGVLEKYSGSLSTLSTQAGKVATAESSLAKAAKTSADAVEAAELKKQTALAKATRLWEQEAAKQTALADKQAAIEAKTAIAVQAAANKEAANSLILMKAYTELNAAKVRQGEAAQLAAQLQVEANQRAIASEYARQQSLVASLGLYERMAAASLSTRAQQDIMQGYSRHEASGPHPSVFAAGPGILGNSLDEQKQAKQGIQAYRSQLRGLRSEIEGFKGLNNWGGSLAQRPEFAEFSKGDMKTYLSTVSSELDKQGMELRARPNFLQKEIGYIGRMAISWVALGAAIAVAMKVMEEFDHSVQEASTFQVQGVLFGEYQKSRKSSGESIDNTSQNDILQRSIQLATTYGDNVNDVAQDLDLWYKRTGDLGTASYMTAQALEFQVATGTDLEDTYRTLTAMGAQLSGQKLGKGLAGTFDLSKTHQLLGMITAAAVEAGAGLHNLGSNGKALAEGSNSADILIKAMEKDAAALKSFGFTTLETVSLNAALIQAFGNTGESASEAAEKIGRLAGGLAGLSNPTKNASLKKYGIDLSSLNSADTDEKKVNVLEQLSSVYEKLDSAQKNYLATQTTGARQYEALIAILENLHNAEKIQNNILNNMGTEDRLASEMQDAFQQSLKRTEGAWESLEITVGVRVLPAMTSAVQAFSANVIPMLDNLVEHIGAVSGAFAGMIIGGMLAGPAGALAVGAAGALAGQHDDNERAKLAKYGPGYAKYKDELANSSTSAYVPGYGNIQTGSGLSKDAQAEQAHEAHVDQILNTFNTKLSSGGKAPKGFLSSADAYAHAAGIENNPEIQRQEWIERLRNPKLAQALENNNLDAKKAEILKGLNKSNAEKGGPLTMPDAGGKGVLKDYQVAGEALSDLRNRYQDLTEAIAENKNTVEGAIASDKTRIQTFGLTSQTLQPLLKDLQKKKQSDTSEISQLRPYESQTQSLADSYKSRANKAGLGTTEGKGFLNEYYAAESEARNIRREISGLKKDMEDVNNEADHYRETLAKTNVDSLLKSQATQFSQLDKQFNDSKSAGSKSVLSGKMENQAENDRKAAVEALSHWPVALQGSVAYNDELQRINDTYVSTKEKADAAEQSSERFAKSLADSMSKGIYSSQQKGLDELVSFSKGSSNTDSGRRTQQIEDQIKLIRELHDEQIRYTDQLVETGGNTALTDQANQLHGLNNEVIYTGMAVDQFKEKLEALQNSDWYKALSAGFDEIGKQLEKNITNSAFGANKYNANITAINETITALDSQKTIEEQMFSLSNTHSAMQDANHKLALIQIQQQITQEQKLAQIQKDKLDHPGFLASTLQSISSTYIQNYIKNLQTSLLGDIGGQQGAQKEVNKALEDYTSATTKDLTNNMSTFKQAVSDFGARILEYKDATVGSGGSSGNLTDNLYNFTDAITNPTSGTPGGVLSAGPTLAAAAALGLSGEAGNAAKTGQNTGGGSSAENTAKSLGPLGTISQIGTALGLSLAKSPIGNALTIAGGSFKNGASAANGGIGAYAGTAGNLVNSFATSPSSGIGSVLGAGAGELLGGPAGMAIGSSLGGLIGSIFGPKYSQTTNPDMYAGDGYATGLANAVGTSNTQANGLTYEDPTLQAGLNNQSELGYIDTFVKAHPGGNGLTGASLQMWQTANTETGGGAAVGAGPLHQGQQGLTDASGKVIAGTTQNWQDLLTQIQNTTQQLVTFNGGLNAANASLVVFNQYGTGIASIASSYNSPGVAANPANYLNSGTSITAPTTVNNAVRTTQSAVAPVVIQLDGKTIATSVQSYSVRATQQGYARIS